MRITNKFLFKLTIILIYFGIVYFILHAYHIDYTKIKDIDPNLMRGKISALGIWIPLIYVIFYILRPLILFPATLLSILGGIIFGYFWGITLVLLGAMLSAVTEFLLARYFGKQLALKIVKNYNLLRIDKIIEKYGFSAIFLIRLVPNVAFDIQNISLGLTSAKLRDYLLGTFLGIIPITFIYVFLGHSFVDFRYTGKILFVLLVLLCIYFIQLFLKSHNARQSSSFKFD